MDGGIGPARGPAPAGGGEAAAPGWRLSSIGASGLTATSIVLLLLYLTGRFLWLYNKDAAAAQAAAAGASPSSSQAPSLPIARPRGGAVQLSLLPVFVHVGGDAERAECAVCLAEFGAREAGRLLPRCGHAFHEDCIATWLRVNTTCPLCRALVATK